MKYSQIKTENLRFKKINFFSRYIYISFKCNVILTLSASLFRIIIVVKHLCHLHRGLSNEFVQILRILNHHRHHHYQTDC